LYSINLSYLYYTKNNQPLQSPSNTNTPTSTTPTISAITTDTRKSILKQLHRIYLSIASLQREDYWLQYVEAEEVLTNRKFIKEYSSKARRLSRRVTDAAGRVRYEELSDLSDFEGAYRRVSAVGSSYSTLGVYSSDRGRTVIDTAAFPNNMFLNHYSAINKNRKIERIVPKLPKLLSQFCDALRNDDSPMDVCCWDVTCSVSVSDVSGQGGGAYKGTGSGNGKTKRRRARGAEEEEDSAWCACRKTLFKLREVILKFERHLWTSFVTANPSSKFGNPLSSISILSS